MLGNPRLRLLVGRYGRQLMVGLAVVGVLALALGGWLAVSTEAVTVTQEVDRQDVETTVTDRAVVTRENDLWETGTTLREKPVYLLNASPTVTVLATTTVEGAATASVSHNWTLTVQATRDGDPFWSNETELKTVESEGTQVRSRTAIDMQQVRERVLRAQQQVGAAGLVSVLIELTVEYSTNTYDNSEHRRVPVTFAGNAYSVGDGLGWSTNHSQTVHQQVAQPRDRSSVVGLVVLGLVAIGSAGALRGLDPDDIDMARARDDLHRRQYAHWISPGTLPFDLDHEFVELESLENVVDVAIDTQERVVHDQRRDLFAVISENVVYYYSTGGNWAETAFPRLQRSEPDEPERLRELGEELSEGGPPFEGFGLDDFDAEAGSGDSGGAFDLDDAGESPPSDGDENPPSDE